MIDAIEFGEYEKKKIHMTITTKFVGYLRIIGIVGKISSVAEKIQIWGKIAFEKIPLKLDTNTAKPDYDRKLEIQILPPSTAIQVRFTDFPKEVLTGEILEASIEIRNSGESPISDIYLASNSPRELIFKSHEQREIPLSFAKGNTSDSYVTYVVKHHFFADFRDITNETFSKDKEARRQFVTKILESSKDGESQFHPNEIRRISFYVQAPFKKGKKSIKLLIYYNVPENYPKLK